MRRLLTTVRHCVFAALCCGAAVPAWAQKTDVVTLKNGNAITCEIKRMSRGRLTAKTDSLGTINIEWTEVVMVAARRDFQIETSTGIRMLGQLVSSASNRVDVITAAGSQSFELIDIVDIREIGAGFLKRLEGSLDFGASYTQSSGVAQLNFNTKAMYRRPSFEINVAGSSYFTRQPDVEDSARHTASGNYIRPFSRKWAALAAAGVESNKDLGYDLRGSGGGGVVRYFIQSNRAVLSAGGGLSTSREFPVEGDPTQSLDALLGIQQSFFTYNYPKTEVSSKFNAYPGLSQAGRIRLEFDSTLKREIIPDFTIGFNIYDSFDNRPPGTETRKNDVGFSLTVGWSF